MSNLDKANALSDNEVMVYEGELLLLRAVYEAALFEIAVNAYNDEGSSKLAAMDIRKAALELLEWLDVAGDH